MYWCSTSKPCPTWKAAAACTTSTACRTRKSPPSCTTCGARRPAIRISGGCDLPVLHYRALRHGIAAPRDWDGGEFDRDFKWSNYLGRYHWRHIDLMDVLAAYQPRACAPLDQIATLLGLPGKMGMSGAKVWDHFLAGDIAGIRNY